MALLLLALAFAADDVVLRTELPLKSPRSRDPVLGGSRDKVFVSVWLPAGVPRVRGAVCNPFSKDAPVSAHWQAACRHWGFAYVGVDLDAVKKDEYGLLEKGLADLAVTSKHPELATMPLCFLGMSRGGGMSVQLAERMPARTIASVPVCLEVGPAADAVRGVPMLTVFGEKDGSQKDKLLAKLPAERAKGSRWAIAPQWGRKHEFGQANNLAFVFLDDVIARRLGEKALKEIPLEDGWLGDAAAWGQVAAWKDYTGDRAAACWLPSRRAAVAWQAFVGATKDVTIAEPAGLGDGQKFPALSSDKPVKVSVVAKGTPTRVELWDADVKLAERAEAPWAFDVRLTPGVHALYAVAHQGSERRGSRLHTVVVGE